MAPTALLVRLIPVRPLSLAGTLQVYSYNRCSTRRKALAWPLSEVLPMRHDITLTPPSKEMLVAAHQSLGDRKLLFNTSGQSYRAWRGAVKALSDDEALEALAADGS